MKQPDLDPSTIDRVIEMAWEDRTPFEAIALQFGLTGTPSDCPHAA